MEDLLLMGFEKKNLQLMSQVMREELLWMGSEKKNLQLMTKVMREELLLRGFCKTYVLREYYNESYLI